MKTINYILIFSILLVLGIVPVHAEVPWEDYDFDHDLVLAWVFEENISTDVSAMERYNETSSSNVFGNSTSPLSGNMSKHFPTGADNYVYYGGRNNNMSLRPDNLTISVTVTRYTTGTAEEFINKYAGGPREYRCNFQATNLVQCQLRTAGCGDVTLNSPRTILAGDKHVISVMINGTQASLWINGTEVQRQGGWNGWCPSTGANFKLGHYSPGVLPFDGMIDDVLVWNRSVNPSNFSALLLHNASFLMGLGGGGAPASNPNMTVNVTSDNQLSVFNINVTVNGHTWTSASNSLLTNITGNYTAINITVDANGFFQRSWTSNSNATWQANLTPRPILLNASWNWTAPLQTWSTINLSCPLRNNTLTIWNITHWMTNSDDHYTYNLTDRNYIVNTSDFLDNLTFWCEACNNYTCNRSSNVTTGSDTVDQLHYFRGFKSTGGWLTSVLWELSVNFLNSTSNPWAIWGSSLLNLTHRNYTATLNLTDLTGAFRPNSTYIDINENTTNYTITLFPSQLVLNFSSWTFGYIAGELAAIDEPFREDFDNDTLVIVQDSLGDGRVHVRFNMINTTTFVNASQYYEYINDEKTHIREDLSVLTNYDWVFHMEILDYTNSPVEDAYVRAQYATHSLNSKVGFELFGQRLTRQDGKTFFFGDQDSEVIFTITKEGYEPYQVQVTIGDEAFTSSEPYTVYLKQNEAVTDHDVWVSIQNSFRNRTNPIYGQITAISKDYINYTTDYRMNNTFGVVSLTGTGDDLDRYSFNLQPNTDFLGSGTDNITLYLYVDNQLWNTYTIVYDNNTYNEVFRLPNLPVIPTLIVILMFAFIMGLIFQSPDTSAITFLVAIIIAGFFSTAIWWGSIFAIIYFIFRIASKVREE